MKGIWKKILVGALLTTSVVAIPGCGCTPNAKNEVAIDLDGDGVVSEWESFFESKGTSNRIVNKVTVVNIENLAGLKAIDGKAVDTAYVLTKNIDCNGETLAINIGASNYLYGNNRIIRNFRLGEASIDTASEAETVDNGIRDYLSPNVKVNCLFYNAGAIYDLNLFMGNQEFHPLDNTASYDVSPLNSVKLVDNVTVKGFIDVKPETDDSVKKFNLSLGVIDHSDELVEISNIETQGRIRFQDSSYGRLASDGVKIGGIMADVNPGTILYKGVSKVSVDVNSCSKMTVGLVSAVNSGFVTTCTSSGTLNATYTDSSNFVAGGICGENMMLAEIKNCSTNGALNFTSNIDFGINNTTTTRARIGGIVGRNYAGIVDYCLTDATITGNDVTNLTIGGICGESDRGIFSNLVSRGIINLTNIGGLDMSNVIGKMAYGLVEKVICTTDMYLNNSAFDFATPVRMGMVTIFEEGERSKFTETPEEGDPIVTEFYDMLDGTTVQKSPDFSGILVGGVNEVTLRPENGNKNTLNYNLGLRNPYLYVEETEIEGEDELRSLVSHMFAYKGLYFTSAYSIKRFDVSGDIKSEIKLTPTYAYADGQNKPTVDSVSDSLVYRPKWFAETLGFYFGSNHKDIDVSGVNSNTKEASLDTIVFTLSEVKALTKFFETSHYNEGLALYDYKFDTVYPDNGENYNPNDEMFSFLNATMSSEYSQFLSLLISRDYFGKEILVEEEGKDPTFQTKYSLSAFSDKIFNMFTKMGCSVKLEYLTINDKSIDKNSIEDDISIAKIRMSATSGKSIYTFTFDIREFVRSASVADGLGGVYFYVNMTYTRGTTTAGA